MLTEMPRILVVYFSRTGHTRQVATAIAAVLGADLDEIVDRTDRSGLSGYLRSGRQAFFRQLPPIADAGRDPASYDLVVVGTPIWYASLSAPVRAYLRRYGPSIREAAFFLTCGGFAIDRVFCQMAAECGRQPAARVSVREAELGTAASSEAIARFAREVADRAATVARAVANGADRDPSDSAPRAGAFS